MDTGLNALGGGSSPGSVEVGGAGDDDSSGSDSQTFTIVVSAGQVVMNGKPCDIGECLQEILETYNSASAGDDDEANFQSGLGNTPASKSGASSAGGGMAGANGSGY